MQRKFLIYVLCFSMGIGLVTAQEKPKLLIFSGAEGNYTLDLDKYRRISFGVNSMIVRNPDEDDDKIELLYSAFNRISMDRGVNTGIESDQMDDFTFTYNQASQSLKILSPDDENYVIGIFNLEGTLLHFATLRGNQDFSLQSLHSGVYVAVAIGEKETKKIKFIR